MPDVLMSPEKMPAKFSMTDDDEPVRRSDGPRFGRLVRHARAALDRLRPWPLAPQHRRPASSAAAW